MTIHWTSLLAVFGVSFGSTVVVVALVTLALVGLSARVPRTTPYRAPTRGPLFSPVTGTAVAGICLSAAAVIVLFGLWALVAR